MHMQAPYSTKKLIDLDELAFTEVHRKIINRTPFARFKDLAKFSMHPVLLEIVLRHFYQGGNSGSFKLGPHSVQFNIEDAISITGLQNERIPVHVENRKAACKWSARHLKADDKVDQRIIMAKLDDLLENS